MIGAKHSTGRSSTSGRWHRSNMDFKLGMMNPIKKQTTRGSQSQPKQEGEFSIFFRTDLVWPNSKPSGITPRMLATRPVFRGVRATSEMNKDRPRNYCEQVLRPIKAPRPETLPHNVVVVRSDPPMVDIDDVEEFLVHDPLFVEFFNAFLALPAFPEPVCFNVETGGFEVVSDGRQRLARQIKEAVRSQNFTPKIYRLARQHAFSDMPLIPIEDTEDGPEGVKIETTYDVTVLNKDQGIYWIKAERLPIFLESDFYFQYRLAKVISQARLFNDEKEFVVMKIDFTPRLKKVKKSVEVPPPNVEDVIVKKMFVSFGDVKGAAKEAWFTQAKEGISTNPKFTTLNPKMSSEVAKENSTEPEQKKRPKSSVFRSPYFGVYAPGLVGPGESQPPIDDEEVLNSDMFRSIDDRPFTPRPSDKIHRSTVKARKIIIKGGEETEQMFKGGQVVYFLPKQDNQSTDTDSAIGDTDVKDDEELEKRMNMQPIIDDIYHDDSWEQTSSLALKSVSELGSVIVGAVMKKTLADVLSVSEATVLQDPKISDIYPSQKLTCISVDDLDKCYVDTTKKSKKKHTAGKTEESAVKPEETVTAVAEQGAADQDSKEIYKQDPTRWNREINKSAEEESDADSLLDSDEDFEEQDLYFRRKKNKWFNLTSLKGIMNFKKFLSGTPGEKYWELWMDIDKARLLHDGDEEMMYSTYMRGKYYKQGSPFELSKEDKSKLGLGSPSSWHKEHLLTIQGKVMEPLVLYWAPRYLLKHLLQTDPDKYYMYSAMKSFMPQKESDPHPMTKSLLPLRPKSCCPRTTQGHGVEEMNELKNRINDFKSCEAEFLTTPKIGNRRIYGEDTIKRLAKTPTARYLGIKPPPPVPKPPSLKPPGMMSRPRTAGSVTGTSVADSSNGSTRSAGENKKHNKGRRVSHSTRERGSYGKLQGVSSKTEPGRFSISHAGRHKEEREVLERCKCAHMSVAHDATKHKRTKSQSEFGAAVSILAPHDVVIPCPSKKLESILSEVQVDQTASGEVLGRVKKPRDLLSPKLRILDTKQQRSRQSSAVHRPESKESDKVTFYRQDSLESSKACDSRPTSGSRHGKEGKAAKVADMTDCDFMGSERMEMLLQALHHDQEAGRAFRKFMEKDEESQVALNCFEFWDNVQDYRKLFYKDKLDLFFINKQAKVIFAQFIVNGSLKSIEVSDSIELSVMDRLRPAYEDLYDDAEEHALKILFAEFLEFLSQDVKTYCKVERSEISRRLETRNTYILNLQKKGIIKERPLTPDDPMDGYVDPVYDESILERIPEEFRDWTFEKLVHNRLELENFRQYLAENYAEIDLKCWVDIEAWRRTPPNDAKKRDQRARDIKKLYLNKKYFFGPSSPAGKEGQNKVMEAAGGWGKFLEDKPHHDAILAAQKYVAERLEKKHMPLFLASKGFLERQMPAMSEEDLADDIGVQKKKRSQAVLKAGPDLSATRLVSMDATPFITPVSTPSSRSKGSSVKDSPRGQGTPQSETTRATPDQVTPKRTPGGSPTEAEADKQSDTRDKPDASPDKSDASPEKTVGSPEKTVGSPDKTVGSPDKTVGSPDKTVATPEKAAASPDKAGASPGKSGSETGLSTVGEINVEVDTKEPPQPIPPQPVGPQSRAEYTASKEIQKDEPKGKSQTSTIGELRARSKHKFKSHSDIQSDDGIYVKRKKGKLLKRSEVASKQTSYVDTEKISDEDLLEAKWLSSAKEVYIFKQAIKNPVTLKQFTRYISVQGEFLENDILFWLEVQRYKEMHHAHTEDSLLTAKITAIIQCFIDSSIPPSLQIDIPQDMADRILDHKHEKGPYLFREAQLATFRILLNHWIPFCEFRNNMGSEEKVMRTLDRHRQVVHQKELKQLEELEKERERQRREAEEADQLLLEESREDEEDKARISFSYSSYLTQEKTAHPNVGDDETQTIRSMLDKSVDTLESDDKLMAKGEEMLMNNRRLSTTSEKRRSSEISAHTPGQKGAGKGSAHRQRKVRNK